MSKAVITYYRWWPHKQYPIDDPLKLYKHISKCKRLDKPKWVIDGRPVGCKKFKDSKGKEHQLWRHFEHHEYASALWSIIVENSNKEAFIALRHKDFDSNGRHFDDENYVDESLTPDLSTIVF